MEKLQVASKLRNIKINKIENIKNSQKPTDVYNKIKEYAKSGYHAIPKEDKDYFLKCFGIFDKPATPNEFMIRIRVPGGQLNYEQAVAIGEISKDFGRDYMDLTTRAQIELRYVGIENLPSILEKLESVKLTSYQTGVDNFRGIVADPLDSLAYDNIIPSQKTLLKMQGKFLYNKEWISMIPRKFNTSIVGSISNRCNAFGHDCCFVLAQKDGMYGYNFYIGGKVGKIAKNADIFLKDEEELLFVYGALMNIFKIYGFRDNRNKNRLFYLIESVGIKEIARSIREYCRQDFATSGTTLTKLDNEDADQEKIILKDDTFAFHMVIPAGIFSGKDMIEAANMSKKYGSGDIRLDIEQNLYILNVKKENIQNIQSERFFKKYRQLSSPYTNHLIACAGEKHCKFGVIPNKSDALRLVKYLEENLPLEGDSKIRIYWSACVKGCGLHDLGDIGFEGCKIKVDGAQEYGVHIFIGGRTTRNAQIGYSVLKSIPLKFAHFYVESLITEYKKLRYKSESFENFNQRILSQYSKAAIGFMMTLKTYLKRKNIDINIGFKENIKTGKNENFEIFEIGRILYKEITGLEAYQLIDVFTPKFPRKLKKIDSRKSNTDRNLAAMVNLMLKEEKPAIVFSELTDFIRTV